MSKLPTSTQGAPALIQAVAFDIDGTLYPHYQMLLSSLPSFLSAPRLMYYFGQVRKEIRQMTYDGSLHQKQAELLARKMGIPVSTALERMERHLYKRWEYSYRYIRPFDQVKETLLALKHAGLKLGALSDFPVQRKLHFLNLEEMFECVLSSEEGGYLKPSQFPFLQLARCFDLDPHDILYVGNSYRYDILGASAVGMRTALISKGTPDGDAADLQFSSYKELREQLFDKSGQLSFEAFD